MSAPFKSIFLEQNRNLRVFGIFASKIFVLHLTPCSTKATSQIFMISKSNFTEVLKQREVGFPLFLPVLNRRLMNFYTKDELVGLLVHSRCGPKFCHFEPR